MNPQAFPTKTININEKTFEINGSIIGHYILENYYNFSFIYYEPSHTSIEPMNGLIENYENFFNTHQDDWSKLIESRYLTDYSPNNNYSIAESVNSTNNSTGSNTNTITKGVTTTTETLKKQSIETSDTGSDIYSYGDEKTHLTKSGNESNAVNSTDSTSVTPYAGNERNLNKVVSTNNDVLTYNNREDLTHREARTDTITKGVTNTVSYVGTEPDTTIVTNNGSDTDVTEKTDTTTLTSTKSKSGYIGVSPINIIANEWNERIEKSITDYICKQFCNETFFLFEGCDISEIEFI